MSAVSFAVNRPSTSTGLSRAQPSSSRPSSRLSKRTMLDSDEEEDGPVDEPLSGFGPKGAVRSTLAAKSSNAPLVILPQPNRDWRQTAIKKREMFRPDTFGTMRQPPSSTTSSGATTPALSGIEGVSVIGAAPNQGGLRPAAMSSPTLAAAFGNAKLSTPSDRGALTPASDFAGSPAAQAPSPQSETEDQRALREILASASAPNDEESRPQIDAILMEEDSGRLAPPVNELDALRADVRSRPDMSTLEDYERVPIDQFGAALLRGMAMKNKGGARPAVQPYVPSARPELLGLGATAMKTETPANKKPRNRLTDTRFVPLARREASGRSTPDVPSPRTRDRSRSPSHRSATTSRRSSRERERDRDRVRDSERTRDRDSDRKHRSGRYDTSDDERRRRRREKEREDRPRRRNRSGSR